MNTVELEQVAQKIFLDLRGCTAIESIGILGIVKHILLMEVKQ